MAAVSPAGSMVRKREEGAIRCAHAHGCQGIGSYLGGDRNIESLSKSADK